MPREKLKKGMKRDHWIEILRSTGVQTGQSRLHNVKEIEHARASAPAAHSKLIFPSRTFAFDLAGGADRDRTDDLKLAKLALSQLSYGP